ncbi:hypothetical protein Tsubulata_046771 [Turnera subulata]|uniref:Uncharacterized protein n=1 Tax=Turnera subulata TaxID=218843 RepID=A0A9Q0FAD3_9ROSI|nr:hypothetical protein Tsubulata_046771 [Turnera subulata]
MQKLGDFKLPHFFNYPPYFTLQPVRDTREKQVIVMFFWFNVIKAVVLSLGKLVGLEIVGSLSHEAREAFLSALVSEGWFLS